MHGGLGSFVLMGRMVLVHCVWGTSYPRNACRGGGWGVGERQLFRGGARDPVTTSVLTKIRNGMEHVYFPERVISSSPIVV